MPRLTWKNDKHASDHSAILSVASGKANKVANSRTKAKRGIVGGRNDKGELMRHASSPFEITLIAGVRSSTVNIAETHEAIEYTVNRYVGDILMKMLDDHYETRTFDSIKWHIADIAIGIYDFLDTMRCAQEANEYYMRKHCEDVVFEELHKEMEKQSLQEMRIHTDKRIVENTFIDTFIKGKQSTPYYDNTDKITDLVNTVLPMCEVWCDKIKADASLISTPQATIATSIKIAIDLIHDITDLPKSENYLPQVRHTKTKRISVGGNKNNFAPAIEGTDYRNHWQCMFDEWLELQMESQKDDLFPTEDEKGLSPTGTTVKVNETDEMMTLTDDVYTDGDKHSVIMREVQTEPVKLDTHTVNLLLDVERNGTTIKKRSGNPTHEIWKMKKLGDTRVFGKTQARSGKLLIMVDCSGSMGYGYQDHDNGYLAYQTSSAIAEAFPNAQTFGFNSTYRQNFIYSIENGHMIVGNQKGYDLGGNTDCSALMFLEQQLQGEFADSMAVIISDGSPNPPSPLERAHLHSHTKKVSHRLYEKGLRYVSVLIGHYAHAEYYPSDVAVRLHEPKDIGRVGEAISRIAQTFNN